MAAPSGIVWGDIAYGNSDSSRGGRIGIYVTKTNTETKTTITAQVWFWSKYSVSDNLGNALYLDVMTSTSGATTNRGGTNIQTTSNSGGWSTSNQVWLTGKSYSWTFDRDTSSYTRYVVAKLTGVDRVAATMNVYVSFVVDGLDWYTVSYNANGGSGEPSSQTKYYGKNLTLRSEEPTRTGYSFQGWALSKANADAGSLYYYPGDTCGRNEPLTLYAVWKADTYTVKYNANGGTGAPGQQTKTYGVTLKLSSTIPKRTNYEFLGWSTSKTATTATYKAGSNYTSNSGATLYAIWKLAYVKPIITNLSVDRCDVDGNITDQGTNVSLKFEYEICQAAELWSITIAWTTASGETWSVPGYGDDAQEGSTNMIIGENGAIDRIDNGTVTDTGSYTFDPEKTYTFTITVTDTVGYAAKVVTLPGTKFIIDILAGGNGIAFNKPAEPELDGVMDIGFQTRLFGGLMHPYLKQKTDLDDIRTPNTYIGTNVSTSEYGHCPLTSGNFSLEVIGMGKEGQVKQRLTYCNKTAARAWERIYYGGSWNYNEADDPTGGWVCVSDFDGQLLWSDAYYMHETQTAVLSEPVSKQRTGIVLVFSLYDNENRVEKDQEIFEFFIPKYTIQLHEGKGRNFNLCGTFGNAVKYLYLWNDRIEGCNQNDWTSMTVGGITYDNTRYVLRHVIGV